MSASPRQIAVTDQWLASLQETVKEPLANVQKYVEQCGGDQSMAYIALCRNLADHIDMDPVLRARVAFSYIATLFLLNRKEQP